ncbi:DNA-directed RNA polymerase subunit D [Candidatus Woesearchaeota archaeon]|nr:DNA-directed RNA polymerase subunit D [Candidatus Woesearchaeota archaeon]
MKLEITEKKKDKMQFAVSGITVYFANALRRTIINEVPTMAVEDVEFRKNSSLLYDEMIAHRLGMVPLKTDLKTYNMMENCTCKEEGCAKCQTVGKLKVKGPKMVVASDMKFQDAGIKPAHPDMPIVLLLKNQELELEATAILGRGKVHVKWIPAHVHYKYKPVIEIGKVDNPEEVAKSCPVNVYEVKAGKLNVKNLNACHLCGACIDASEGKIKLNEKNTDFIFYVESFGQLDANQVVEEALKVLESQLDEVSKNLK